MRCEQVRRQLPALRENSLTPPEALLIREHLERCPSCAEEAGLEDHLASELALVRRLSVPAVDVRERVLRRVRVARLSPRPRLSPGDLALIAAAVWIAAAGICLAGVELWTAWPQAVGELGPLASMADLAPAAGKVLLTLLSHGAQALLWVSARLFTLLAWLTGELRPVTCVMAGLGTAFMATSITAILARDRRLAARRMKHEERFP